MSLDELRVCVRPGDGLVARLGCRVLVVLSGGAPEATDELLDIMASACASPPGPAGHQLARRLAQFLVRADPDDVPDFGALDEDERGFAAILYGRVQLRARAASGEQVLSGRDAANWVDRIIRTPVEAIALGREGEARLDHLHPRLDLGQGIVPGGGLALVARTGAGAAPSDRAAGAVPSAAAPRRETDAQAAPPAEAPERAEPAPAAREPAEAAPAAVEAPAGAPERAEPAPEARERAEPAPEARERAEPAPAFAPPPPPLDLPAPAAEQAASDAAAELAAAAGAGDDFEVISLQPAAGATPAEAVGAAAEAPAQAPEVSAAPGPTDAGAPTPAPAAAAPVVEGIECYRGHFNHPLAAFCSTCGVSMVHSTTVRVNGPRPPLGVVVLDNGATFSLDSDYVVGTDPAQDPGVSEQGARPLALWDPAGSVSVLHADIRLSGWDVTVVDRGSAYGTFVWPPGATQWLRLNPGQPLALAPGTRVAFGQRTLSYESHHH